MCCGDPFHEQDAVHITDDIGSPILMVDPATLTVWMNNSVGSL